MLAQCLTDADFRLVSGGTDNHLMLVDLTNKDVTGKDAEHALDAAGITVNKNTIPFETRSPFVTSGVRLGTAALTTRGMKEDEAFYFLRFFHHLFLLLHLVFLFYPLFYSYFIYCSIP